MARLPELPLLPVVVEVVELDEPALDVVELEEPVVLLALPELVLELEDAADVEDELALPLELVVPALVFPLLPPEKPVVLDALEPELVPPGEELQASP